LRFFVAKRSFCIKLKVEVDMAQSVRINQELVDAAKSVAKVEHRSLAAQVEHWAAIGRAAEENPDLPFSMIREILLAKSEAECGLVEEYVFDEGD
jgi:hypothetical protein